MAYGDYGAFVYLNGERRTDREDVGVCDTDEAFGYDKYRSSRPRSASSHWLRPSYSGAFAMDAITHLAVPQAAMINDMLEMVQNG
jgi:hypothetical protein